MYAVVVPDICQLRNSRLRGSCGAQIKLALNAMSHVEVRPAAFCRQVVRILGRREARCNHPAGISTVVTRIVTLATTAPDGSTTRPTTLAVGVWAQAQRAAPNQAMATFILTS